MLNSIIASIAPSSPGEDDNGKSDNIEERANNNITRDANRDNTVHMRNEDMSNFYILQQEERQRLLHDELMEEAKNVIDSIESQLAFGDNPPSNEDIGNGEDPNGIRENVLKSPKSPPLPPSVISSHPLSSKWVGAPPSVTGPATSSTFKAVSKAASYHDTTAITSSPSYTPTSSVSERGCSSEDNSTSLRNVVRNEAKLGNCALVDLCRVTLERERSTYRHYLEDDQLAFSSDASNHSASSNRDYYNRASLGGSPSLRESSPRGERPSTPKRRIQMFGSEYARFLSTNNPLSPSLTPIRSCNNSRRKTKPSMPSFPKTPTMKRNRHSSNPLPPRSTNLEDAPSSIQTGAITDILIFHSNDTPPPKGFYRISLTPTGSKANLSSGDKKNSKHEIYIYVKKEPGWDRAAQRPCITALTVIFPDRKEFVPPGFCVARRRLKSGQSVPANLNAASNKTSSSSSGEERIFLCFKRSREGNPVTGIVPMRPFEQEYVPVGYTVLEFTPRNHVALLNPHTAATKAGCGGAVFLAFRQRLANLETFRPWPLRRFLREGGDSFSQKGYYATGGTVVRSEIGKFHILDRSTHPMLSPSSVTNRLSLIQASRERSAGADLVVKRSKIKPANKKKRIPRRIVLNSDQSVNANSSGGGEEEKIACFGHEDHSIKSHYSSSFNSASLRSSSNEELPLSDRERGCAETTVSLSRSFSLEDYNNHGPPTSPHFLSSPEDNYANYHTMEDTDLEFIPLPTNAQGVTTLLTAQRMSLLVPILTALYTHHGGAAMIATTGLCRLLRGKFFEEDCSAPLTPIEDVILTPLDITVRSVCDLASSSSREAYFPLCVEFVSEAVRACRAGLHSRTLGCVVRFYLFVFYFGASVPNGVSVGAVLIDNHKDQESGMGENEIGEKRLPREEQDNVDSAERGASLALKEMVGLITAQLATEVTDDRVHPPQDSDDHQQHIFVSNRGERGPLPPSVEYDFVRELLEDVVEKSIRNVDVSNFTQIAIHQIHRSGGSELFWHDMISSCGFGLFGQEKHGHVVAFAMLAYLVKVASGTIRQVPNSGTLIPRDVATKLLSLELLLYYLQSGAESLKQKSHHSKSDGVLAYTIRRLVVTCLLSNTANGMEHPKVFERMLSILTVLWKHYREYLKVEISVLFDQFFLRIIRLGPQVPPSSPISTPKSSSSSTVPIEPTFLLFEQQLRVLDTFRDWFQHPDDILQLYYNYDHSNLTSATTSSHSNLFSDMFAALCTLAEQCGEIIALQIHAARNNPGTVAPSKEFDAMKISGKKGDVTAAREAARNLQDKALEGIRVLVKGLTRASWRVYLDHTSDGEGNWDPDDWEEDPLTLLPEKTKQLDKEARRDRRHRSCPKIAILHTSSKIDLKIESSGSESIPTESFEAEGVETMTDGGGFFPGTAGTTNPTSSSTKVSVGNTQEAMKVGFEIISKKGLRKGLEYLIACNILTPGPRDIASFLRIHQDRLDASVLGDYLGEGGHAGDGEYWNLIRYHYVRAISFAGMNVEEGLRHFLTRSGFRLPGEAQKIDRIISTFSQCYWEDNAGDHSKCPFRHCDVVFLLSFAIIMLNTDLHKANIVASGATRGISSSGLSLTSGRGKQRKKMSKQDFIHNLRGVDHAEDLSKDYLSTIYNCIEARPIAILDPNFLSIPTVTAKQSTISLENWTADGGSILGDYSIMSSAQIPTSARSILKSVKPSLELLRGLAVHKYPFQTFQNNNGDANDNDQNSKTSNNGSPLFSPDFLRTLVKSTWHHFYSMVNSTLNAIQLDPRGMVSCLHILQYAISTTLFLDMEMERRAFLLQLARIHFLKERGLEDGARRVLSKQRQGTATSARQQSNSSPSEEFQNEEWFRRLEDACNIQQHNRDRGKNSSKGDILRAVKLVKDIVKELCRSMKMDRRMNMDMLRITRNIRNGEVLLNDPVRYFVHEGNLLKRSNRTGRNVTYRFFLFSDVLIYTHRSSTRGDFKIHEKLFLYQMKIADVVGAQNGNYFQIHHPRKTLSVCALSVESKNEWMEKLKAAVERTFGRKAGFVEGSKMSSQITH